MVRLVRTHRLWMRHSLTQVSSIFPSSFLDAPTKYLNGLNVTSSIQLALSPPFKINNVISKRLKSTSSPLSSAFSPNSATTSRIQSSEERKSFSTSHADSKDNENHDDMITKMGGDLWQVTVGPEWEGKSAWIYRTFDPQTNAAALLSCGGPSLARHASFDPEYTRARDWIRRHPVGPAVLSPVLLQGLLGALVEASVPHAVSISVHMNQHRPLIVGVEVCAKITVSSILHKKSDDKESSLGFRESYSRTNGFEVTLKTEVNQLRDGVTIADGQHKIWVPDFLNC